MIVHDIGVPHCDCRFCVSRPPLSCGGVLEISWDIGAAQSPSHIAEAFLTHPRHIITSKSITLLPLVILTLTTTTTPTPPPLPPPPEHVKFGYFSNFRCGTFIINTPPHAQRSSSEAWAIVGTTSTGWPNIGWLIINTLPHAQRSSSETWVIVGTTSTGGPESTALIPCQIRRSSSEAWAIVGTTSTGWPNIGWLIINTTQTPTAGARHKIGVAIDLSEERAFAVRWAEEDGALSEEDPKTLIMVITYTHHLSPPPLLGVS
ncbi:unnamed protein product [Microthlaspi erraticum]|uniref:Uncharacterized protein n=1 Tax=Microthlaspi erraticum TaxID=1685480 RepID=A0A6D2KIH6_9BRAS|nr:unnamed protein product [Microthlaspi erraticum]